MRLLCAEGQLRSEASADSAQLSSKRDGGDNYAAKTKAKRRKKRKKNREREKTEPNRDQHVANLVDGIAALAAALGLSAEATQLPYPA